MIHFILYQTVNLIPVLTVNNLSSVSCVCTPAYAANISVADQIVAKKKNVMVKTEEKSVENITKEIRIQQDSVVSVSDAAKSDQVKSKQKINGSISAYSYSDFSNTSSAKSTQFRYTLSLDARNIANSKFSVENYISFKHKAG